jgi:tRNA(adenine34) deaminase
MIGQPTAKDYEMMDKAIQEARAALASGKVGVAALLVWREEILALGHNGYAETGDQHLCDAPTLLNVLLGHLLRRY